MADLAKTLAGLSGIHAKIAADVWPLGGRLDCGVCTKSRTITSDEAAGYLARGWPKCCGQTMCFAATKGK